MACKNDGAKGLIRAKQLIGRLHTRLLQTAAILSDPQEHLQDHSKTTLPFVSQFVDLYSWGSL